MNKTERTQIAQTLRATAQKLSAKALPGDKWDEDGVNDAIKELVQTAMGRDETASTFKLKNQDLWLLDDAVLGWQNVKKHTGEFPSDDKAMVKRVEDAVKKNLASAPSASTVKAKTKVRAASGKPGSLKDGIWQGEVVSEKSTLTDILESLDQDHLAKLMSDTMGNFDSDYVPDAGELARMNSSKVPDEASRIFADAAGNAYRSAWENAAEGYFVKTVTENLISLLNDASGTAQYTGEDTDGEEVEVEVDFDVTAKETGDVDGVFSNPYIEVTITNPGHLSNYAEWVLSGERTTAAPVDQPGEALSALSGLLMMLKSESSREVKNVGDVNTDNSDMDWDLFQENFESNVLEMAPDEIAEAIQAYADDSDESVEDVVDMAMKAVPGLNKKAGAIASALEGGYDARQQKLPLSSASASLKALAAAEKAIKAAARKPTPKQQKKLDDKRIEQAYYKVADGVQIDMMAIPKVFKVGEKAIAEGADDAALEKAIADFVETIREN